MPRDGRASTELLAGLSWEQGLGALLEILPVGCMVQEAPSGVLTLLNQEGEYLVGPTLRRLTKITDWPLEGGLRTLAGDPYPAERFPPLRVLAAHQEASCDDLVVRHPDGREVVLWWRALPLDNAAGAAVGVMSVFQDITKMKEVEQHLERQSQYDELTQLPNRRGFTAQAAREFERARRGSGPVSVLMLDLDHFKRLNDQYGHLFGDAALKALAGILRQGVRPTDLLCRWGGEEFAVLAPGTTLADGIHLGERLRRAVSAHPVQSFGVRHRMTVSIGVAALGPEAPSLEALMSAADVQLYQAKGRGRDCVMPLPG